MTMLSQEFWDLLEKKKNIYKTNEQINSVLSTKFVSFEALGDVAKDEKSSKEDNTKNQGSEEPNKSEGDAETKSTEETPDNSNEGEGETEEGSIEQTTDENPDDSTEDDDEGSSDLDESSEIDENKPGKNPFRKINGRQKLADQIFELENSINSTIEYMAEIPNLSSVVVNGFMELRDIIKRMGDTIHMVPIEETLVRYTLAVKSYKIQVKNLKLTIKDVMNMEE